MQRYGRTRWIVAGSLAVVSTLGLTAAGRPAKLSGCTAVAEWVKAHRSELPTTYAEVIRYPLKFRKPIQAELSWSTRHELWLTQYRLYEASGLLTAAQKEFVREAEKPLAEMLGDNVKQARREAVGDSLTAAALPVLGRDLTHSIMFVLGPDDLSYYQTSKRPSAPKVPPFMFAALNNPAKVPEIEDVNCTCHWGVAGPECSAANCGTSNCAPNQGCGNGGVYSCNGMCNGSDS